MQIYNNVIIASFYSGLLRYNQNLNDEHNHIQFEEEEVSVLRLHRVCESCAHSNDKTGNKRTCERLYRKKTQFCTKLHGIDTVISRNNPIFMSQNYMLSNSRPRELFGRNTPILFLFFDKRYYLFRPCRATKTSLVNMILLDIFFMRGVLSR